MPGSDTPVFFDPAGRRWRRTRRLGLGFAVAVTALAIVFITSVLVNPLLPRLNLRPLAALPHVADIKPKPLITARNPGAQRAKHAAAALQ